MRPHVFFATIVKDFVILATFGIVSPYVAVAASISMSAYFNRSMALFWYFADVQNKLYDSSEKDGEKKVLEFLNDSFHHFYRLSSRRMWILAFSVSAISTGLLIFDFGADNDTGVLTTGIILFLCTLVVFLALVIVGNRCFKNPLKEISDIKGQNAYGDASVEMGLTANTLNSKSAVITETLNALGPSSA